MVPNYVALLRGINVGGNKKIAMADLRAMLSDLGYGDVATLLQSGNAVFSSSGKKPALLVSEIESAIGTTFGMSVRCLIRTGDELRDVIDGNPLLAPTHEGSKMMAHFLAESPDPERLAGNNPIALDPENVALGDRVIYQWCPDGLLAAPPVGAFVDRYLKVTVTARNWNTVTKLGVIIRS